MPYTIGFDREKYIEMQSEHISARRAQIGGKLYLEMGGKLFDDNHACRVLPGFTPDNKIAMLERIKDDMEIVGADGVHVGVVDHMDGDRIKMKRKDEAHGVKMEHHHYIPMGNVASVDGGKVWLSADAANARQLLEEEDGSPVDHGDAAR